MLAYQDFMDQAAEKLGGDFYILPSSIHEILLVPDNGDKARHYDRVKTIDGILTNTKTCPEETLLHSF